MKYVTLLILTVLIPFWSFSQSNFKAGYVITLNGDTIKGFIDYRGWDNNPTSINFKDNLTSSTIKRYTINNINYFSISNIESYQKFIGSISTDETNIERLSGSRDTSFKIDTVFLKILQKGKNISLYQYSDEIKTRYFFGEYPDYKPKELIYKVYNNNDVEKYQLQNKKTIVDDTYLKQLFATALKYNSLDDDLSRLFNSGEYKDYYLLDIATKINQIKKTPKAIQSQKSITRFYAGAGINIATTNTQDGSAFAMGGGKSFTSLLPSISIGINTIPYPNFGRFELRLELLVAKTKFDEEYTLKVEPYVLEKAYFDQLSIIILPQIIYNVYNAPNYKIFLGCGLGLIHNSFSNEYFGVANPNESDNGISNNSPFYFDNDDTELLFKAGFKTSKHLAFYINYITSTPITKGGYFQLTNSTFNTGFLYFFGK